MVMNDTNVSSLYLLCSFWNKTVTVVCHRLRPSLVFLVSPSESTSAKREYLRIAIAPCIVWDPVVSARGGFEASGVNGLGAGLRRRSKGRRYSRDLETR